MSERQSNSTFIAGSSPVACSGFRPGDVAYIASWNYGRRLILSINGDIAECLDMQGHECRHSLRGLQTLSQWINTSRRLAEDSDLKMSEVNAYITAMSAPYDTPPQWVAALQGIQNVKGVARRKEDLQSEANERRYPPLPLPSCSLSLSSYQASRAIEELKLHLPNVSFELSERIFSLLDVPSELFRLESGPASVGADMTVFLEPSDRLLDLLAACRAFDLHV